ncbi:MAG: deaminase [Planctomycetes bacterium]|nr:deaminase [Planctomycetota bacterium]MCP4770703.1 deaminase [Planctomycetota bacterium]MCP4861418.1 deaminase [Planctomycetota bacterium]
MQIIHTENSSQAIGPYSQAIKVDGWVYTSGVVGMCPDNSIAGPDIVAQTRQVFANLIAVLGAADCTLKDVVKATVYLADMDEFATMNEIYSEFMDGHKPARSCVEVQRLPRDLRVEIDVVARPQA